MKQDILHFFFHYTNNVSTDCRHTVFFAPLYPIFISHILERTFMEYVRANKLFVRRLRIVQANKLYVDYDLFGQVSYMFERICSEKLIFCLDRLGFVRTNLCPFGRISYFFDRISYLSERIMIYLDELAACSDG